MWQKLCTCVRGYLTGLDLVRLSRSLLNPQKVVSFLLNLYAISYVTAQNIVISYLLGS